MRRSSMLLCSAAWLVLAAAPLVAQAAPISTTRSNIKHGVAAATAPVQFTATASYDQMCQAAFDQSKAMIESMAQAGNTAGIQGLLARAGCRAVAVNVEKQPASNEKSLSKISCSFKLIPPTITCTFGMASLPVRQNAD